MKSFFKKFIGVKFIGVVLITLFLLINITVRNASCLKCLPTKEYVDNIIYSDWICSTQTAECITSILQLFNQENARLLKNQDLWINKPDLGVIDSIISGMIEQPRDINSFRPPFIPYLVKWIIPQDTTYITIGDLHGNLYALKQIITHMQCKYSLFADFNKMKLKSNIKIIFLGDYMDRGEDSIKVFTTTVLLSLKNPGQVLMLRGNHEDMASNLHTYNLYDEINEKKYKLPSNITLQNIVINSIIDELAKAYEFLPVGAFIGYCGTSQTKFNFHVHGCIDPRIDYNEILEFNANELSQNGGIRLWRLRAKNIMPLDKLSVFYADIISDPFNLLVNFSSELRIQDIGSGFMWHDVALNSQQAFTKSHRGELASPILDACFLRDFSKKFDSNNYKISVITRAHDHSLSKKLTYIDITNIDFTKTTPSCVIMQGQPIEAKLLNFEELIDFGNNFGIITIISASVKLTSDTEIKFPPTFLISSCGEDGNHLTSAFYDSALLEY